MSRQAIRARSVSEIVDATFTLYRNDASAYIMVTAIASAPGLIAQMLLIRGVDDIAPASIITGALLIMVVSMVTYALMTGVVTKVGSDVYLGGTADVASAVRAVLPKVGTLIAVAIGKSLLLGLFAILFFFPFFYAASRWFAPEVLVVIEDKKFGDAFSRCSDLSDGLKGHIFLTLLLGWGIYFLLAIGMSILAGFVGNMFGGQVMALVLQTVFTVIAYPIIGLMSMMLYYDARIKKEGFDVEHLSRGLEPGSRRVR